VKEAKEEGKEPPCNLADDMDEDKDTMTSSSSSKGQEEEKMEGVEQELQQVGNEEEIEIEIENEDDNQRKRVIMLCFFQWVDFCSVMLYCAGEVEHCVSKHIECHDENVVLYC